MTKQVSLNDLVDQIDKIYQEILKLKNKISTIESVIGIDNLIIDKDLNTKKYKKKENKSKLFKLEDLAEQKEVSIKENKKLLSKTKKNNLTSSKDKVSNIKKSKSKTTTSKKSVSNKKKNNGKTTTSKKTKSVKNVKKKKINQGFQNLLDLSKHISLELNISNSSNVKKLASQVLKDVKEKFPNIDVIEKGVKAIKHFDDNKKLYKI